MKDIIYCPALLTDGFNTYSPTAIKRLFQGKKVSHIMDFNYDDGQYAIIAENTSHISVSGVQEKLSAVLDKGKVRLANEGERGRFIIKPAPDNKALRDRKQIPANEHLTMQIARQVYNIMTAENGMIFLRMAHRLILQDDLMNTSLHTHDEDFALEGGLSDTLENLIYMNRKGIRAGRILSPSGKK